VLNKFSELEDTLNRLIRRIDQKLIDGCKAAATRVSRGTKVPFHKAQKKRKLPQVFSLSSRRKSRLLALQKAASEGQPPKVKQQSGPGLNGSYWNTISLKDDTVEPNVSTELDVSVDVTMSEKSLDIIQSPISPISSQTLEIKVPAKLSFSPTKGPLKVQFQIPDEGLKAITKTKETETKIPSNSPTDASKTKNPAQEKEIQSPLPIILDEEKKEAVVESSEDEEIPPEIEEPPKIICDNQLLNKIFDHLVQVTQADGQKPRAYNLERVIQLHSDLLKLIQAFRANPDKTELLKAMQGTIKEWEQNK